MAGASGTLDPVAAARADIAQSRDLIASAADDLYRHQRFLDGYRLAEIRHARRLKRQELLYQLELRWLAFSRLARWNALSAARDTRNVYRRLSAETAVALRFAERNGSAAAAWAAPKLDAANLWLAVQAQRLWLTCRRTGEASWTWTARQAAILWRQIVVAMSAGLVWTDAKLRASARRSKSAGAFTARWARVEFDAARLATRHATSTAAAWSARKRRRGAVHAVRLSRRTKVMIADAAWTARQTSVTLLGHAAMRAGVRTRWRAPAHVPSRALAIRRSTALICVAPPRAQLPALRTAPLERREDPPQPKPPRKAAAKSKPRAKQKAKTGAKRKSKARPKRKTAQRPKSKT